MAKQSLIEKHKKQTERWDRLNAEYKKILELPKEQRDKALAEFNERRVKNRDFRSRRYNRCSLTGRASGYFRFFGVCRHVLREKAHKGELPGVMKSSW
jgi:small subunit ribosomal protein S14